MPAGPAQNKILVHRAEGSAGQDVQRGQGTLPEMKLKLTV